MTAQEVERAFASFLAVGRPVVITMILASWLCTTSLTLTYQRISRTRASALIWLVIRRSRPRERHRCFGRAWRGSLKRIGDHWLRCRSNFARDLATLNACGCCGYIFLSSIMLFGVLGYSMWDVAIRKWELIIDQFTFCYVLVNFALVGVIAVFYQKGTPTSLAQATLCSRSSWRGT